MKHSFRHRVPFDVPQDGWYHSPASLRTAIKRDPTNKLHLCESIAVYASGDWFKSAIGDWNDNGQEFLPHVKKIKIVGAGIRSADCDHRLTLPTLRWLVGLIPNCASFAFIGVALLAYPYPYAFPVEMRHASSLYIADTELHTRHVDGALALSEFTALNDVSLLSSHWLDGISCRSADLEIPSARVTDLQFDSVRAKDTWRVGRAVSSAAILAVFLCRIGVVWLCSSG